MASLSSNPIYQHSGETQKIGATAMQASVTEDMEQRRRLLDSQGETRKIILAKEVAHIIDESGSKVHLKHAVYPAPKEPLLQQAQHTASNVLHTALETGKNILHSASSGATHVGHDAASYVTSTAKGAVDYVSHAAHEAAHQAANVAGKVRDTTANAAGAVGHKAKELAEGAAHKAHEIADNISHFTTLVSVLAEEENERARRLVSGDEALAASNAFRVSELIRDLGEAFYKQKPNLLYTTKLLEEMERRWRLNSPSSSLAESNAHSLGRIVSNNLQSFMPRYQWVRAHINTIEEKERTRRLNDSDEVYAILNSLGTAELIRDLGVAFYRQEGSFGLAHRGYATTLLEENERRYRIRVDKFLHVEDSAHLLMDVVANNIEKFSYSTRHAARFANEFANMIGSATLQAASTFTSMTRELAKNTAQRVRNAAGLLTNFTTMMYIAALEEKERARRLSDPLEIYAIDNAWKQSAIIRDCEYLYRPSFPYQARYPLGLIEATERSWRLLSVTPSNSRKVAAIVKNNLPKFEQASLRAVERDHAREIASHSRLNPRAAAFVPQPLPAKAEPAPVARTNTASGAQL